MCFMCAKSEIEKKKRKGNIRKWPNRVLPSENILKMSICWLTIMDWYEKKKKKEKEKPSKQKKRHNHVWLTLPESSRNESQWN